jgi:hypothetical protein
MFGQLLLNKNKIATVWRDTYYAKFGSKIWNLKLSALMDLYIHPPYVLVSKILSSILNSLVPIHPLYYPLSTLSTVGPTCHFI